MSDADPSAVAVLAFPSRPDDSLRLSLRRLEAALAEQSRACAEWRAALGSLQGTMGGLRDGFLAYQASLAATAAELRHARAAAQALEATADAMLERARHSSGG